MLAVLLQFQEQQYLNMKTLIVNYQILTDNGVIESASIAVEATEETILKLNQLIEAK